MEAGHHLQQAADAPLDLDLTGCGGGDARQDLGQGALAGAVAADDAGDFARADLEVAMGGTMTSGRRASGEVSRVAGTPFPARSLQFAADDAQDFARADLEADIAPGPEFAADAVAVVGVADFEPGGGLPPNRAWRRASSARANLLSSKRALRKWINPPACSRLNRSGSRPGPRR